MPGFSKDKKTGRWFCSDCGAEVPKEVVFSSYDYFNPENNKEHKCGVERLKELDKKLSKIKGGE